MAKHILIVEDDITFSLMLKTWLGKKGFTVDTASNIARAKKQLEADAYDLVLSDLRLPDEDGIVLLTWMDEKEYHCPLIIMTGYADIQSAVLAMKRGAKDYIAKPVQPDELLKKINETLQQSEATQSNDSRTAGSAQSSNSGKPSDYSQSSDSSQPLNSRQQSKSTPPQNSSKTKKDTNPSSTPTRNYLEGESESARQLYNYVGLVAPTHMAVLINGASGTGKEYVAHRIHQLSKRADKPFVAIDCGSIPKELAASEFFGHIKGSFTGALTDKTGAFEEANGGTLFLDEIGNLSYEVQIQLLRALQEHRIRPVGSSKEIEVDVRLISATNENLESAIEKGAFREDLFHRINEFTLRMPSLKERQEDILLFANFFLDQANRELGRNLIGFDAQASLALQNYTWPGNLRQMKNIIKRATLLAQSQYITYTDIASELIESNSPVHTLSLHNEEAEKNRILEALRQTNQNKSRAAQLLGIDRKTLYNKLKLYGIQ